MTPEELIGRVQALEWLITTVVGDAIAREPLPFQAATAFQGLCMAKAESLTQAGKAQGEDCGRQTILVASALLDLSHDVINTAAAGAK